MGFPPGTGSGGTLGVAQLGAFIIGGWAPGAEDIDDRVLVQMDDEIGDFRRLVFVLAEYWLRKTNVVRKIAHAFNLDDATGARLDMIGSVVVLPRRGFADERYRAFLKIQTQLILAAAADDGNWSGTVENLVSICRTYKGGAAGDGTIRLYNTPPYAYILDIVGVPLTEIDLLTYFLCRASYAGVVGSIYFSLDAAGRWDSEHAGAAIPDVGVWGSATPGAPIADVLIWGTAVQIGGEGLDC